MHVRRWMIPRVYEDSHSIGFREGLESADQRNVNHHTDWWLEAPYRVEQELGGLGLAWPGNGEILEHALTSASTAGTEVRGVHPHVEVSVAGTLLLHPLGDGLPDYCGFPANPPERQSVCERLFVSGREAIMKYAW